MVVLAAVARGVVEVAWWWWWWWCLCHLW